MTPDVTVCLPVYRSEHTVGRAIESVLAQTHEAFRLHISVDPSDDRSAEVCRSFAHDPRVSVTENDTRLGWVGNVNACLDAVDTSFFLFCFHDDTLDPICLERLLARMSEKPDAVSAFGAIEITRGARRTRHFQDIEGDRFARAAACLTGAPPAFGLKSLLRSGPVRQGLRMPEIGQKGYRADLPFSLAYSLCGTFAAVPDVVYRKIMDPAGVTASWHDGVLEQHLGDVEALQGHLLRVLHDARFSLEELSDLVRLVLLHDGTRFTKEKRALDALIEAAAGRSPAVLLSSLTGGKGGPGRLAPARAATRAAEARHSLTLAQRYWSAGDEEAARQHAERAVRLDGRCAPAFELLARLTLRDASVGGDRRQSLEAAKRHAEAAVAIDPTRSEAHLLLARSCFGLDLWQQAHDAAVRAIDLGLPKPERAESIRDRARRALDRGG
ncbi:glycosyltransferase [Thalassococcus sp. BH17M4-6]|uniref:glycosyltransferase n=1 Tax=Thalassococcus sp. BH17M4-6 TaxID=3413148 RepID=UPI003BEA93A7